MKDDTLSTAIFTDARSQALLAQIRQVAQTESFVLIQAEAGTGKEVVARQLHALSPRAAKPFVVVHCAALDAEMLTQGLHGHERGACRGGFAAKAGWFELAEQGTLYLDDVCALPLNLQDQLLASLQFGQVTRLGARQARSVDVRLIASAAEDLDHAVEQGRCRPALRALLANTIVQLPALRDRPGDILPLARHFIAHHGQSLNFPAVTLETDAAQALLAHAWPGHVRELENVVHGAMLLCEDGVIRAQDLRLPFSATSKRESDMGSAHEHESLLDELESLLARLCLAPPEGLFSQVERSLVRVAFAHCGRNQIRAAQLLGLSRNVLRGRLIEHGEINALK